MSGGCQSPLIMKRGRCHSPGISSKVSTSTTTPGTRCLVFLRRCLAIQLQKVGSFPNNSSTTTSATATSCTNGHFDGTVERDAPLYWMYDSGYLIFQVLFFYLPFSSHDNSFLGTQCECFQIYICMNAYISENESRHVRNYMRVKC